MATAASVYTNPPLRKVYDITLGSTGGTAGGDTATIAVAHGIDFTDNTVASAIARQFQVNAVPYGTAPAYGAVPYYTVDATNVNIGFMPSDTLGVFTAGVVRCHFQRVHSVQG